MKEQSDIEQQKSIEEERKLRGEKWYKEQISDELSRTQKERRKEKKPLPLLEFDGKVYYPDQEKFKDQTTLRDKVYVLEVSMQSERVGKQLDEQINKVDATIKEILNARLLTDAEKQEYKEMLQTISEKAEEYKNSHNTIAQGVGNILNEYSGTDFAENEIEQNGKASVRILAEEVRRKIVNLFTETESKIDSVKNLIESNQKIEQVEIRV